MWPVLHCTKSGGFDFGGQLLTPCFPLEALRVAYRRWGWGWGHTFPINSICLLPGFCFSSLCWKVPSKSPDLVPVRAFLLPAPDIAWVPGGSLHLGLWRAFLLPTGTPWSQVGEPLHLGLACCQDFWFIILGCLVFLFAYLFIYFLHTSRVEGLQRLQ